MKILKKILYLFLIIFTISFSLDGEKSKVVLDKSDKVAELKIGVTKLISKELPLEFHVNSKKIYGEIDIDDNDLVFVSETLDEMPSVSTTNGRKAINNIKKYLTKEIKKAPKFEYQIINGKDEGDRENGKKYLLVDCKEQLSGIYIYVVEQGTYKVKTVYRGVFKQLLNANTRSSNYGTIHFTKDHPLTSRISRVDYDGTSVSVDGKDTDSIIVEGAGGFPKKFVGDLSGRTFKGYRIRVKDLNTGEVKFYPSKHYKYFEDSRTNPENKIINMEVNLYGTSTNSTNQGVVGKLRIMSKASSKYLNFEMLLNYPTAELENEIFIDYGNSWTSDGLGGLEVLHTDTFKVKIDGKEPSNLPPNTKGTITILKGEHLYNTTTKIYVPGKSKNVTSDNLKAEVEFEGEYLKTLDINSMEGTQKLLRITVENRNGLKKVDKSITLDDGKGNIAETYGEIFDLYDVFGVNAGKINVGKINKEDKDFTLTISDFPEITEMVNSNIILEYISRSSDNTDKIVKEDVVTLYIKPREQTPLKEYHGNLTLYTDENLHNNDFFIGDGALNGEKNASKGDKYDLSRARYYNIPVRFEHNQGGDTPWVYWGKGARILIEGPNFPKQELYFTDNKGNKLNEIERKKGSFITHHGENKIGEYNGWINLEYTDGTTFEKGFIQFNMESDKEGLKIGFRGALVPWIPASGGFFNLAPDKTVDSVYHFKYQRKVETKGNAEVWDTIKEDTIRIVIDPTMKTFEKKIKLSNPLVYYDYGSSSAISNIVHNRRAHIAENEAKTLTSGGAQFTKNTDLTGKNWIETEGKFNSYEKFNKKHKVTIRKDGSEVIKMTDSTGRTPSSTFIGDTDTVSSNSRDGRGNEVMFSYDGGNNYLNFGLSKYNFAGGNITNISITNNGIVKDNDSSQTDTTSETEIISVEIPRFEGIHYVNPSYDIKPASSYTKDYEFNNEAGNKEIIIDYGTVGFRDLDTRITHQSKGEGIEIRAYTKVVLQSVSDPDYIIKGAELYFEDEKFDGDVTYFKGENERATSKLLKLKIPTQETLIPKDNFKILRADTMGYPLEVGVTVNKDKTKYYTPIDNEVRENGAEGKNLYLNLTTRRYVETTIEFENPNLKEDNQGINWIQLNKEYPTGKLSRPINNSDLWGRIRGEVIDIPVKYGDKVYDNLILKVFQENPNGNENPVLDDLTDKQVTFAIPKESNKNFIIKYDKGNNFIEFSLDKGYDESIKNREPIVFYIRYMDGNTKDKDGKPLFLFDQKYTIKFKDEVNYLGDATLIIKNPSMLSDGNDGRIRLKGAGESVGKDNKSSTYDKEDWHEVQNVFTIPKDAKDPIMKKIGEKEKYKEFDIKDGYLEMGLLSEKGTLIKNGFKDFFEIEDYKNGKEIETSFSLEVEDINGNPNNYRVNVIIEKFDSRYYGKVYPVGITESTTYSEINSVGEGIEVDLTKYIPDEYVYIDLGTTYRDYSRYQSILETLEISEIFIDATEEVDVISKDNETAPVVKGKIVFQNGQEYLDRKKIETLELGKPTVNPKTYPLYLKLTQAEYRKLKPYTSYEIFLNGNPNVLKFDVTASDKLDKEMLLNKPLNFSTKGPNIEIRTEVLDFGQIKPGNHKEPLITKKAVAAIKVDIKDELAREFTTVLEPEIDEIWIHEKNDAGEIMANGEKLKVRSIVVEKRARDGINKPNNETNETIKREDDFVISGVLEVPNKTEPKRGKYGGYIRVNFTYY